VCFQAPWRGLLSWLPFTALLNRLALVVERAVIPPGTWDKDLLSFTLYRGWSLLIKCVLLWPFGLKQRSLDLAELKSISSPSFSSQVDGFLFFSPSSFPTVLTLLICCPPPTSSSASCRAWAVRAFLLLCFFNWSSGRFPLLLGQAGQDVYSFFLELSPRSPERLLATFCF